jgi:hypothetical protein
VRVPAPIIDMHLHAMPADYQGSPPVGFSLRGSPPVHDPLNPWAETFDAWHKDPEINQLFSPMTDDELRDETLAVMEKRNMIGVVSGVSLELTDRWRAAAPDRVIPGVVLYLHAPAISPSDLGELHAEGRIAVLGEVANQYNGIDPSDPQLEPYLAVAEELDIPVQIHVGPGPPGAPYLGFPNYRGRLHSPLLLEEILVRHPRVRLYVAHAGWPMLDDMLALLYTHPRVYVDVGILTFGIPTAEFHRYLRVIVEAGFGDRVMFGSDQMVWPGAIEPAIGSIEAADFLSDEQKRAILYDNAARFLRLTPEDITRHRLGFSN